MNLGAYRLALDLIVRSLRSALLPVLRVSDWNGADARKSVAAETANVVREHRRRAAEAAGEFMTDQAARQWRAPAFIPAPEGYPDIAVEQVFRESRSVDEVIGALERHVETAARRQVVRAVPAAQDGSGLPGFEDMFEDAEDRVKRFGESGKAWKDLATFVPQIVEDHEAAAEDVPGKAKPVFPVAWARVPTGAETCPFCFMLASRGPVYSSYAHATKKTSAEYPPEATGSEQAYHDNCDCMVVPVYNRSEDWPGKAQYERLEREWGALVKNLGGSPTLAAWREHLTDNPVELPDIRKAA